MSSARDQLVVLYQALSCHTAPECAQSCKVPHSCCSGEYCHMAMEYAREEWGLELAPTGHATLPLMGETGCVAPPHLRPLCTLHTCAINGLGFKPGDDAWTEKYFELRGRIEELEVGR